MAKSAICPGLITIIWSLITSNSTGLNDIEDCSDELIEYVNYPDHDKSQMNYLSSVGGGGKNSASASSIRAGIE